MRWSNTFIPTVKEVPADASVASHRLLVRSGCIRQVTAGSYSRDLASDGLTWSDETYRIFGYEPGQTTPSFELVESHVHPDDRQAWLATNDALMSGHAEVDHEYRIVRKDGEVRHVRSKANLLRDPHGRPLRYHGAVQDITDRKQAEEELRHREERFRYIMKHNPNAIAVYDKDLNYIMVSDRYLEDYGIQDHHVVGRHHYEVFPEVPERWRAVHRRVLAGTVERAEVDSFIRPDGSVTYNRWECRPWYDPSGEVGGIITYTEVITDRIEAQRAVEAQRRLFFDALEAIPAFVYLQAPDYAIRFANRRFRERFGEPGNRPCYEVITGRDGPCQGCRTFQAFTAGHTVEWEWQAHDGRTYMIYDTPMHDVDGSPLVLEIGIDITDRKQAEEALRESEGRVRAKLDAILMPEGDIGTVELADILDVEAVQNLMDDFYDLTGYGVGIVDNHGDVLVAEGWQDICTKFHRVHPETCENCIDSDTRLSAGTEPGAFKIYRCKNNMWDMATPIILGERHLGNVFLGQFFFTDEEVDEETFRDQARRYGFDEREYIQALHRVPRWTREELRQVMRFYADLARLIGTLGYSNIKLARTLTEHKRAEQRIREDAETRAVLLREVNHRVKNNLTAIIGMLYAEQRRRTAEGQPAEDAFNTLIGRIRSLSTVHSMLSSSEWGPVPLCDLARQIVETTIRSLGQDRPVTVDVPRAGIPVTADQAHHLAPILSELVTNSLKHSADDRPLRIHLAAERAQDDIRLTYRDNGPGLPDEALDPDHAAAGVGLDLIANMVSKSLKGTLTLRNDGGAVTEILFPEEPELTP